MRLKGLEVNEHADACAGFMQSLDCTRSAKRRNTVAGHALEDPIKGHYLYIPLGPRKAHTDSALKTLSAPHSAQPLHPYELPSISWIVGRHSGWTQNSIYLYLYLYLGILLWALLEFY